jgi:soluble lytic murein transglycosylase-like protein
MLKFFIASFFAGVLAWHPNSADSPNVPAQLAVKSLQSEHADLGRPAVAKVSAYVARAYRISEDQSLEIVSHAFAVAEASALSPFLILGIIAQESSFNPKARSSVGATGLMQILPRWHPEKIAAIGGITKLTRKRANIQVGAAVLNEYLGRGRGLSWALKKYSGGARDYEVKVLAHADRFRAAAR